MAVHPSLSVIGTTALAAAQLFRGDHPKTPKSHTLPKTDIKPPQSSSMQVKRYHRWCEIDNGGSFVPNGEFEGVG